MIDFSINISNVISLLFVLGAYLWSYLKTNAQNRAEWRMVSNELSAIKEQMKKIDNAVSGHQEWIIHHLEAYHCKIDSDTK